MLSSYFYFGPISLQMISFLPPLAYSHNVNSFPAVCDLVTIRNEMLIEDSNEKIADFSYVGIMLFDFVDAVFRKNRQNKPRRSSNIALPGTFFGGSS